MARPKKSGLDFYYTDVHQMDEYQIMMLMNKFGPLGYAVYSYVLSRIYLNGYYLEFPLDFFAAQTLRVIGAEWVKKPGIIIEILEYCGEIGLLDRDLLRQSVLTSREIQQNYSYVSARRSADRSKYWLLEENESDEDIHVNDAESDVIATIIPQSKVNESKENDSIAEESKEKETKEKETKENKTKENKTKEEETFPANSPESANFSGEAAAAAAAADEPYIYDDGPLVTTGYAYNDATVSSISSEYIYDDGPLVTTGYAYNDASVLSSSTEYIYDQDFPSDDVGYGGHMSHHDGVEDAYHAITGRHLTDRDYRELDKLSAVGVSDNTIREILKSVARRGEKEIYSFKYFVPIIRQMLCLRE